LDPERIITRNFLALLAGRVVTAGSAVIATFLLARALSTEEFGLYALFVTTFTLAASFVDFGANTTAAREIARGDRPPGECLGVTLAARAMLAVGALGAANLYLALSVPASHRLLVVAGTAALVPVVLGGMDAWFHATGTIHRSVLPRSSVQIAFVAALGGLFSASALDLRAAVVLRAGSAALAAVLVFLVGLGSLRPVFRGLCAGLGPFLRRSAPIGLAGSFTLLYFHLDTLMLQVVRGAEEVGVYQAAYRVFGFGTTLVAMLVFPFFPFLSKLHGSDRAEYRRLLGRATFLLALASIPPALTGAILADEAMSGFYGGGEYARSALPLRFLMGSLVAVAAGTLGSHALLAANRAKRWTAIAAAGLGVNAVLNLLVLRRFGAPGAAATTLVTEAGIAVAALAFAAREGMPRLSRGEAVRLVSVSAALAVGALLLRGRSIWAAAAILVPVYLLLAGLAALKRRGPAGGEAV